MSSRTDCRFVLPRLLGRCLTVGAFALSVGCSSTSKSNGKSIPDERDEPLLLNRNLRSLLEPPPANSVANPPVKMASGIPGSTGMTGINVKNSFDRRAIANHTPINNSNLKPPVSAMPDTGMNGIIAPPTVATSGGNLPLTKANPTPSMPQQPIQQVSNTQPATPVDPNPPIKIVGTTSEQSIQPATPAVVVVTQPNPPVTNPPVVVPPVVPVLAAPELPKSEPVKPVAVSAPVSPVTKPVEPIPTPGQLVPLSSPAESRPSGLSLPTSP